MIIEVLLETLLVLSPILFVAIVSYLVEVSRKFPIFWRSWKASFFWYRFLIFKYEKQDTILKNFNIIKKNSWQRTFGMVY